MGRSALLLIEANRKLAQSPTTRSASNLENSKGTGTGNTREQANRDSKGIRRTELSPIERIGYDESDKKAVQKGNA